MATLADNGRITVETVDTPMKSRVCAIAGIDHHAPPRSTDCRALTLLALDLFDRATGKRRLPSARRRKPFPTPGSYSAFPSGKATVNDADRLRKVLARFGLTWDVLQKCCSSVGYGLLRQHLHITPGGGRVSVWSRIDHTNAAHVYHRVTAKFRVITTSITWREFSIIARLVHYLVVRIPATSRRYQYRLIPGMPKSRRTGR